MMRTRLFSSLALVFVILIGFLSIPWFSGMLFKSHYVDYIKAIETKNQFEVKIIEYNEGWFTSTAKLSIKFPTDPITMLSSPSNKIVAEQAPAMTTFVINQLITHGPLVVNPVTGSHTLALGSISSNMHAPPTVEAFLFGANPNSKGVISIEGMATFGGDYVNKISTPVFNVSIPAVGEVVWQGLNGTMIFYMNGKKLKNVVTDIKIGAFTARSPMGSLVTKDAAMKYDIAPVGVGLWNGSYEFLTPEINFTAENFSFLLKDFAVTETFGITSKDNFSLKFHAGLGQLVVPEFSINQSNIDLAIDNINVPALEAVAKTITNLPTVSSKQQGEQYLQYVVPLLPPLIVPQSTGVKYNIGINTSYGRLITNLHILWVAPVKVMTDFAQMLKLNSDLRISISLVNEFINKYAAYQAPTPASAEVVSTAAPQSPEDKINGRVKDWSDQGIIDVSVGVQIKDLITSHASQDAFATSVDQFVKLKQISPEIAANLKAQYSMLSNAPQPSSLPTAAPPKPYSQVDMIKNQIAELVKAGFIKVDKEDYVVVLTVDQGVIKANGLDVNPSAAMAPPMPAAGAPVLATPPNTVPAPAVATPPPVVR